MKSFRKELWFEVPTRRAFINITPQVNECLAESGIREGLLLAAARPFLLQGVGDPRYEEHATGSGAGRERLQGAAIVEQAPGIGDAISVGVGLGKLLQQRVDPRGKSGVLGQVMPLRHLGMPAIAV